MASPPKLPAEFFAREDESDDADFYREPRLVTHIDDVTIAALTQYYRENLAPQHRVLDLMSSWISHLPEETRYQRVVGHGMNAEELAANPRLDEFHVQDLNRDPTLPFTDGAFDAVLMAVSVQYLTQPFEVFAEIGRVLAPGGQCIVAMSHRLFPTKAIYAFHVLSGEQRCRVVAAYLDHGGAFETVRSVDRSPQHGDPLWLVHGLKAQSASTVETPTPSA